MASKVHRGAKKASRPIWIGPKKSKVIGVFSCKGGVGKTTTAVNLATFLNHEYGSDVIVVEANLTAPNVGIHLGIADPPITMHDVLAGRASIERAVSVSKGGLHFVPGRFIGNSDGVQLVDLKSYLEPLRRKYRYVVLDLAPGLGPEVIAAVKACDELLVVTNPEIPTIATTLRTFGAAQRYRTPITGVVVNMVRGKRYEVSISEIRKTLGWPIVAVVPDDEKIRESTTVGTPVLDYAPSSPAAKKFRELGEYLLATMKTRS